jgi:hypothetical protein
MNDERDLARIEQLLRLAASDLRDTDAFPATPPITVSVRARLKERRPRSRAGWPVLVLRAAAVALAAFVVLLLISPDVREAVARFFGLNTVRVEFVATPPAPTPAPTPSVQPTSQPSSGPTIRPTRTPTPTPALTGLTTLADARSKAEFDVRLPTYPTNLREPKPVYFQDFGRDFNGAQQVILVYPDFVLYEAEGIIYQKSIYDATRVEETRVGDNQALWLTGAAHLVQVQDASGRTYIDFTRIVKGSVLAWEANRVTYRIETELPLDEAIRIAESIR